MQVLGVHHDHQEDQHHRDLGQHDTISSTLFTPAQRRQRSAPTSCETNAAVP